MERAQTMRRIEELVASSDEAVAAVYLFGSVARGTAGAGSDVDVAILVRSPEPGRLGDVRFRLEAELERALGCRVQVVLLNTAPPDLVHRVLRDGRLVVENDASARIAFEVRSRNEYFDLLPILDRYRRREAAGP